MRRRHDNSYLHFTKKERRGIIVILCIAVLLILLPSFYSRFFHDKITSPGRYATDIKNLKLRADSAHRKYTPVKYAASATFSDHPKNFTGSLFYFDPNLISAGEWKKLGVRDKTISTIQNYISKGGRFREPDDIKKIWGLQYMADRLLPYVKIQPSPPPVKETPIKFEKFIRKQKEYTPVDINEADSNGYALLPGIGPGLSRRIIRYREKLGGFYSADQIAETFGLPDSTYQKIRPSLVTGERPVKKININTATLEEMKAHPYIRYHLANVIVQYRAQHGNYNAITEIKNIMLVNDSIYKKVSPYLKAE